MLSRRLCLWLLIACLPANFMWAGELRIYPAELVVSHDYPARMVVLDTSGDQAMDVTHASDLKLSIEGIDGLNVDSEAVVRLTKEVADGATGKLIVRLHDQERSVPIRVAIGKHLSPIFPREVSAVLGKTGCNLGTCHGNLHGKAGFRLSLRGDDPVLDYAAIVRGQGGRRLDRFEATQSLLLQKPLGQVAHQGGVRLKAEAVETRVLTEWIAEGCHWNRITGQSLPTSSEAFRPDETLESLSVYPASVILGHACREQQLVVTARFADGVVRDVTSLARFEPSVVTGVTIDTNGRVTADRPADVSISVSYLNGRSASRLIFLASDEPAWSEPLPTSRIDELVEGQLRRMHIRPAPMADNYTLVRRIYLATIGRLPTADEVRDFCRTEQVDAIRYAGLVERLLQDEGYAKAWSMRWSDLLRNEQKVMSEKGAQLWHAWMTQQVADDRPMNEFVAEMITTLGSTYEHPPAGFHRTHRDPETAAESIGQVFLGVRLQCARCHNHPFDKWRQDDYYGLAAYFTTLERKQVDNSPKDKFDKHIISGDELIAYKDNVSPAIWHPGRAADVNPKPLTQAKYNNVQDNSVKNETVKSNESSEPAPLDALAKWLTVGNRLFARNMANRIWYHVMGVGIVDPPDDFRDSNPPSNPELLEYLTDELIRSQYSTRYLTRLILNSRTFQRQSAAEATPDEPLGGARVFAGYPMRRMSAEVLYDAISDVTDVYSLPEGAVSLAQCRSMSQVNVPTKAGFMQTFGKPGRLLVCECERSSDASLGQSLVLVNGLETRDKIAADRNRIDELLKQPGSPTDKLETLFLTTLARPPRREELDRFVDYVASAPTPRSAWEDVLWALMNSKEFSLIR